MTPTIFALVVLLVIVISLISAAWHRNPFAFLRMVEEAAQYEEFDTTYIHAYNILVREFQTVPIQANTVEYPSDYNARRLRLIIRAMNNHKHITIKERCTIEFSRTQPKVVLTIVLLNPVRKQGELMVKKLTAEYTPNQFRDLMLRIEDVYRVLGVEAEQ